MALRRHTNMAEQRLMPPVLPAPRRSAFYANTPPMIPTGGVLERLPMPMMIPIATPLQLGRGSNSAF